jgi:hypothetical protein
MHCLLKNPLIRKILVKFAYNTTWDVNGIFENILFAKYIKEVQFQEFISLCRLGIEFVSPKSCGSHPVVLK